MCFHICKIADVSIRTRFSRRWHATYMFSVMFLWESSSSHFSVLFKCIVLFILYILLIILFIYISTVIPPSWFPLCKPSIPSPHPCVYEGAPPPTHPLLPHSPKVPLHWGIRPLQEQGPLLPLMPDKTVVCYIFSWSPGSLHVYSLVVV
jgi:hypothetical protein